MSDLKWYVTDMTSNTAPSPLVASASSESSTSHQAWQAFQPLSTKKPQPAWQATYVNEIWIKLDFGKQTPINRISLTGRQAMAFPLDFQLMASNDDLIYVDILTISQTSVDSTVDNIYYLDKVYNYRYYKLVTKKTTSGSIISISKFLFGLELKKRLAIKKPTTNQLYSLAEKTLIPLPDSSSKNMISHGIEAGKEIRLDEEFDKFKFINYKEENLDGDYRLFTVKVDNTIAPPLIDTKVNEVK